ncbi:flagellar hook-length control protein FliK [Thermobrachium celere]|uniref:Flagellar hook-length control protein-like C-terminal domain-containing protein n=1 Tax=Thermobrachium celere DSM 8682 TaxID=941824 RepID=R7RRQ0_9CLOT|nr:flagellar hook-length control protein FliK [Thermobrachium celere]CDF58016.1 hypothetical protein TCEL_01930 [Thermobrachium celere DSM 8682]
MKIENVISTNKFISSNSEKTKLDKGDYFTQIFDSYINDNSNQETEIDCNNTEIYNLIKNILSLINENNELNNIQNNILSTINNNEGLKDFFINLNSAITNADSLSVIFENFKLNDNISSNLSDNLYKFLKHINDYINIKHNEITTSSFDNIQSYVKQQINDLIMKEKLFESTYQLNYAKNEFLNNNKDSLLNLDQITDIFIETKNEPNQLNNLNYNALNKITDTFNETKFESKQFINSNKDTLNQIKNILNELKNDFKSDSSEINLLNSGYNKNDFIVNNLKYINTHEVTISNPREILDVIVQKINILKNENLTEMKLLLKPRELGEISINLRYKNGELEATITTNNKNITSIINNNIDYLKEKISAIDYKIASVSININTNDKDSENKNKNLYRPTKKSNKPKFELNEEMLINNI